MNFKNFLNNTNPEKLKTFKKAGIITGSIIAVLYLAFLIVPHFINLNNFMPMISSEVEKLSGFKLSTEKPKLSTTLKLGVKIKAENVILNYKDDTPLAVLKKPEIEINLPSILIGHINLDKIKADEFNIYLTFNKNKQYTVMEYIDNIIKNTVPDEETNVKKDEADFNFPIEIRNINIKAGKIALHLKDENVNKTYLTQLNNSILTMKSLQGPLRIKTEGFTGIEDSNIHFANFDIDIKTKLPKIDAANTVQPAQTAETQEFELNFNPFKTLEDFNLRTDIFAHLNIKDIENFRANGDVNIGKFSLKLGNIQLPESYLNINFKDRTINLDSKAYVSDKEFLQTKSSIATGKKSKLDLNLNTEKITLKSLKDLIGAILDICCIENDIKNMTAGGYINGNFDLNTDFKRIKSNGEFRLIDGNIAYSKAGFVLSGMKAFLDFSDNALNIKDTSAFVNGAKFDIKGEIAQNADINLTVKSDPLKIKDLINLASEFKLVNKKDIADFEFKDGALTVALNVIGDFKNIKPKADVNLNNFKMLVKSAKMPISIDDINITARPKDKDDMDAVIAVSNIKASMEEPKINFNAPNVKITADMTNIEIKPASALLEGTSVNVSGGIKNYMKSPELNIKINGNVHPNTVYAFIPDEMRTGITHKGLMPYEALISGGIDNIKIAGNLKTNASNYISIINIPSTTGQENTLSIDMALKNDILDLTEISAKSPHGKLATIKGQIKNIYAAEPVLSNLNINIPNKLTVIIPPLFDTSLNIIGDISLQGKAFSPDITGYANIDNLKYPDYGLTLETLALNFNKTIITAKANNIKVANSDFSGDADISTNFLKGVFINSLNYNSGYMDTDALIALADKVMKSMPAPAPAVSSANNASSADLGIVIKNGGGKIAKLKSGTLIIENINYDHKLTDNVYYLNNLNAAFAQGTASGNVSYNIMNGKIAADMGAENISLKEAAKQFIGIDLVRSGTLQGNAKVTLSGATLEEQIRTLNGTVKFEVRDGEYGESISFARFINAANVLNLGTFSSILNTITAKVNSFNTQEFKNIDGLLNFNNGVASVSSFKSQGPNMSLAANGTYNLLNNYANLKITGKVSSKVADALGNLGTNKLQSTVEKAAAAAEKTINKAVDTLTEKYRENKAVQAGLAILGGLKNSAGTGGAQTNTASENTSETAQPKTAGQIVTSMIKEKVNPLFGTISAADIANIPALSTNESENTKNFQVIINGLITNPKSIKSLKFQPDNSISSETNAESIQ